jgi:hypothetical protein
MTVSDTFEGGILYVVEEGEFSLVDAQRTFLEMLEMIRNTGARKVLFDGREVTGEPVVIERFYYGEFAANSVENFVKSEDDEKPQFAYVLREPVLDPLRLGETVAVNRGMNVKAFQNVHEAVQWLNMN